MEQKDKNRPILSVSNLTIDYAFYRVGPFSAQHHAAVENVSFKVYPGDCFAIVGESGCGKTSILNAILGFVRPKNGAIFYNEQNLLTMARRAFRLYRPEIQPVFQDFHNALNPRFRIIEILKESLRICSRKDISIEELIAVVGLGTDILNYFPHQLSGGQKQRIVIARALIPKPQLLLLDEPVSSLDITVAVQIIKLLKNLRKKENLTFLLVSHNLPIIRLLANRIAIMKNGHILEEKPTEDLFETPEHPYTRALVNQALISCQSYQ